MNIQEDTRRYTRINEYTVQEETRGQMNIQKDTRRYKRTNEYTRGYKKIQEDK